MIATIWDPVKLVVALVAASMLGSMGWWEYRRAVRRAAWEFRQGMILRIAIGSLVCVALMSLTIFGLCAAFAGLNGTIQALVDNLARLSVSVVLGWYNLSGIVALLAAERTKRRLEGTGARIG